MSSFENPIPGAAGGRQFDQPGEASIETVWDAKPGVITIDGQLRGDLGVSGLNVWRHLISAGKIPTVDIEYSIEGLTNVRNKIKNLPGEISDVGQISPGVLRDALDLGAVSDIREELMNIPDQEGFLKASIGGNILDLIGVDAKVVGESPYDFTKEITFPTMSLPNVLTIKQIVSELPSFNLVIRVKQTEPLQRLGAELLDAVPEVKLPIPGWALFDFKGGVGKGEGGCGSLFPDIDDLIRRLRNGIDKARQRLQDGRERLQSVVDQIPGISGDVTGGGIPTPSGVSLRQKYGVESLVSRVKDVRGTDVMTDGGGLGGARASALAGKIRNADVDSIISRLTTDRAQNALNQLNRAQIGSVNVEQLKSRFQDARNRIESLIDRAQAQLEKRCLGNLLSRLLEFLQDLDLIEKLKKRLMPVWQALNDLLGTVASRMEGVTDIGCQDISRSLRNRVRSFESGVDQLLSMGGQRVSGDRAREVLNEGKNIRSEIQQRVGENNPCKQTLLSDIESGINRLSQGQFGTGVPRFPGRRRRRRRRRRVRDRTPDIPTSVPCSEEFSSISDDVNSYVSEVENMRPSEALSNIDSLINRGQDLVSRVRDNVPSKNPCAEDFLLSIRGVMDRLDRLQGDITIIPGDQVRDISEERQQKLEDTINRLDEIARSIGDTSDIGRS